MIIRIVQKIGLKAIEPHICLTAVVLSFCLPGCHWINRNIDQAALGKLAGKDSDAKIHKAALRDDSFPAAADIGIHSP
jgi:hypothetical protein